MRNIREMVDEVAGAKVKSVLDLSNGFFSQMLEEASRPFTAFGVPGLGHWEYTRSAQGLCNSPAAFQRLLDHITAGLPRVLVYIDDVIVCSESHEQHLKDLETLFCRFRSFSMKCRVSKVQLGAPEVNYLGFNISEKGVRAGEAKTEAIKRWTFPSSPTEIKQFLGLCGFFRHTIPKFAELASPLNRLTRKDSDWKSGALPQVVKSAFQSLQAELGKRPCLAAVDFSREFTLTVDASSVGLGAILSQVNHLGREHPVAYASRALKESEAKRPSFRLEHLAMKWACAHFRPYLVGPHFTLRTDHRPLVGLNSGRTGDLQQLQADLHEYLPFTVKYLPGSNMPADGLSRLPAYSGTDDCEIQEMSLVQLTWKQVYNLQLQDTHLKAAVLWAERDYWPADRSHQDFVRLLQGKGVHRYFGVVCVRAPDGHRQVVAPAHIRPMLLSQAHEASIAGHFGVEKTTSRVLQRWFWPTARADVENFVRHCPRCLAVNDPAHKPLRPLSPVSRFNERVHLDLLGPLPADQGHKYLLVLSDAYSKLLSAVPIPDKTAPTVATATFKGWISLHGPPEVFVSDHGREFDCEVFRSLCSHLGIDHHLCSVGHPQSNGQVEQVNRTFLQYVRKFAEGGNQWADKVPSFVLACNTAVHETTRLTPYYAAFGRLANVPPAFEWPTRGQPKSYSEDAFQQQLLAHDQISRLVTRAHQEAFLAQKAQFDRRARLKTIRVGDRVYVTRPHRGLQFQKFQPAWMGPFVVLETRPNDNVLLSPGDRRRPFAVHLNRVKLASFSVQVYGRPLALPEEGREINNDRKKPCSPAVYDDNDNDVPATRALPVPASQNASPALSQNASPAPSQNASPAPSVNTSPPSSPSAMPRRDSSANLPPPRASPEGQLGAGAPGVRVSPSRSLPDTVARATHQMSRMLTRDRSRQTGEQPVELPLPPRGGSLPKTK